MIAFYNKEALTELLEIKAAMADDTSLPADFDFCVSVTSLDLAHRAPDDPVVLPPPGPAVAGVVSRSLGAGPSAGRDEAMKKLLASYGVEADDMDSMMEQMIEVRD
jgi:hypothetical protein